MMKRKMRMASLTPVTAWSPTKSSHLPKTANLGCCCSAGCTWSCAVACTASWEGGVAACWPAICSACCSSTRGAGGTGWAFGSFLGNCEAVFLLFFLLAIFLAHTILSFNTKNWIVILIYGSLEFWILVQKFFKPHCTWVCTWGRFQFCTSRTILQCRPLVLLMCSYARSASFRKH